MGRPYGTVPRRSRKTVKKANGSETSLKITLRNEDGTPLSMPEIRDGFYEVVRKMLSDPRCHRAKRVSIYVNMIDQSGKDYLPDTSGEWEINPYRAAADEHKA